MMEKRNRKRKKKGGDAEKVDGEVKLGRPLKEDRGDIVRKNGYTENQWEWLEREALLKGMDTMTYIRRYPIQWWMDSIEASRADPVFTSEEDKQFEELVSKISKHSKSKQEK